MVGYLNSEPYPSSDSFCALSSYLMSLLNFLMMQ